MWRYGICSDISVTALSLRGGFAKRAMEILLMCLAALRGLGRCRGVTVLRTFFTEMATLATLVATGAALLASQSLCTLVLFLDSLSGERFRRCRERTLSKKYLL